MKHLFTLFFMVLVLTGSFRIAPAEVYFWTDGQGVRHYSNIGHPDDLEPDQFREDLNGRLGPGQGQTFTVTKVYDGDTLLVRGAGLQLKIRLAGIDSPETGPKGTLGQPYAEKAKSKLVRLVKGKKVRLKSHGLGGFNRVLAEVFDGRTNINLAMIRAGLAEVYRGRKPGSLETGAYFRAEKIARKERRGMWAQGERYKSPKDWRRVHPRK